MSRNASLGLRANISLKYHHPVRPIFARHETFHPRHGWLKKGLDKLVEYPDLFFREDGPTILGVGKNMAKSIRYWLWAFKLTNDDWKGNKTVQPMLDWLGNNLIADQGFDPYLEDPASLWLLHWNLLKQPCYATTWDYAFNHFREQEFSPDSLLRSLKAFIAGKYNDAAVSENSLKNDVACFVRMYVRHSETTALFEESLDCPFAELGLLTKLPKSREYSFVYGPKPSLPNEIITVACLECANQLAQEQSSISAHRLLFESGSPGLVFKIGEADIWNALESVSARFNSIRLVESAGRLQLHWKGDLETTSSAILESYYERR